MGLLFRKIIRDYIMAIYKQNGLTVLRGAMIDLSLLSADLGIPENELTVEAETEAEKAAEKTAQKLTGVDFEGVMVSATSEDQHGLNAIWTQDVLAKMAGGTMPAVNFVFENGAKVVLSDENIESFKAVWLPFRMSFFPMPEANQ